MNLKERAKQLKSDIPAIFLALKDRETPFLAKALAALIILYALSPIDLIPDFIPVLGYLDDLIILPVLITVTVKLIPKPIMERCRQEAVNQSRKEEKWVYAIPFAVIWLVLLFYLGRFILQVF